MKNYILYDQGYSVDARGESDRLYPGAYLEFENALNYVISSSRLIDVFSVDGKCLVGVNLVVRLARYKGV